MNKTTNYDLNKLQTTDKVIESITALSENADIIDTTLADLQTQIDQGGGGGGSSIATNLTADLYLVNGTYPDLEEGYYYTNGHHVYINGTEEETFDDTIFYVFPRNSTRCTIFLSLGARPMEATLEYTSGVWSFSYSNFLTYKNIDTSVPSSASNSNVPSTLLLKNQLTTKEDTTNKVTTISSSSTDTEYPSAKAVYDQLETKMNASTVITTFWHGTQAQYDALGTYDSTTLYLIDEE